MTNTSPAPARMQVPTFSNDISVLDAAIAYAEAGFYVLPLESGTKHPGSVLGKGWQEKSSRSPSQLKRWFGTKVGATRGIAIHMGRSDCVALDVDNPEKLPDLVRAAIDELEPPYQATRLEEIGRGHYIFRQPEGRDIGNQLGVLANGWGELRGKNGIIVVSPSVHAKKAHGGVYEWLRTGDVPVLPLEIADKLADHKDAAGQVTSDEVDEFLSAHKRSRDKGKLTPILRHYERKVAEGGSRHEQILHCQCWAMREAQQGWFSAQYAAEKLFELWKKSMCRPTSTSATVMHENEAFNEFTRRLAWAIGEAKREAEEAAMTAKVNGNVLTFKPNGLSQPQKRRLKLVKGSETVAQKVEWLWAENGAGRLPAGTLSIGAGDGNIGKSPFTLMLAAKVTCGELEGDFKGTPRNVLIYASEDSWAHTIVPRLQAAGADMDRVYHIEGTETDEENSDMPLDWAADFEDVEGAMRGTEAALLIIDPLMDVIDGSSDSYKDKDVRDNLDPLKRMAQDTGAVVMGLMHFNKAGTNAKDAMMASKGFFNLSRSVFAFAEDKVAEKFVFTQIKNNLGRTDLPSLNYKMESVDVEIEGELVSQPVFKFTGVSERTVDDALKSSKAAAARGEDSSRDAEARSEALDWLLEYIEQGDFYDEYKTTAVPVAELKKHAAEQGHSWATINRARQKHEGIQARPDTKNPGNNRKVWLVQKITLGGHRIQ